MRVVLIFNIWWGICVVMFFVLSIIIIGFCIWIKLRLNGVVFVNWISFIVVRLSVNWWIQIRIIFIFFYWSRIIVFFSFYFFIIIVSFIIYIKSVLVVIVIIDRVNFYKVIVGFFVWFENGIIFVFILWWGIIVNFYVNFLFVVICC